MEKRKKYKKLKQVFVVVMLVMVLGSFICVPTFALDGFTTFDKWNYENGYDIYEADTNMLYSCTPFTITWYDNLSLTGTAFQGFHGYGGYACSVSVAQDTSTNLYTTNVDIIQSDERQDVIVYDNINVSGGTSGVGVTRYRYTTFSQNMFNFVDESLVNNTKVIRTGALFEIDNHHYFHCDNYPFGCQMEADNIIIYEPWLTDYLIFDEGIGGFTIPYTVSPGGTPLWNNCTYSIEYDIINSVGSVRHYENSGVYEDGVISSGERLYLIPSEDYDINSSEKSEWLMITNLKIVYKFGDRTYTPTNTTDPSFTYYTHDTMVAFSDNTVPFEVDKLNPDTFINVGNYSGISPSTFYSTLVQNERYLAYQNGFNAGSSSGGGGSGGVSFTNWLGDAIGGFMSFELYNGISIGGILIICIAFGCVFLFLKFFAGG